MRSLKWSTSHAVFVLEIDDEHQEIFEALSGLQQALGVGDSSLELRRAVRRLATCVSEHFAHEERLMRAARYESAGWHRQLHDAARRRVKQFGSEIGKGRAGAGAALAEYLTSWLDTHTRLADRMLGAFLRNHRRIGKVICQAATKPTDSCEWVDSNGDRFHPRSRADA
jgi:hemerythrin